MLIAVFVFALAAARTSLHAAEASVVKLTHGSVFIPADYRPGPEGIELTLHLHGAPDTVTREFLAANRPGVLVNLTLPGLSKVYADHFRDLTVFPALLREVTGVLHKRSTADAVPDIRLVTVTSFSAGFGGVRELLKQAAAFQRIDALIMADSIYAGFVGDPSERQVNSENMAGFLRFAQEAVVGRKRFIVSHSLLHTPDYASTGETAAYLIGKVQGRRTLREEAWPGDRRLISRFARGRFEVLEFAGDDGEAHMEHLRMLADLLRRLDMKHAPE